jgi:SAM-dependent methyltransferase
VRESPANLQLSNCPVCAASNFTTEAILWPELIEAWQLSPEEAAYIDLQQGLKCARCENNLRAMTLATAIMRIFGFDGSFQDFCRTDARVRQLTVLEVNAAGKLSPFLRLLPKYRQSLFPDIDLQRMEFADQSIDVVIHSDTLEHVPNSRAALRECRRVLNRGGYLFYTIPIVVGRWTRTRQGLPGSYHGNSEDMRDDYLVQTEYGADFWCELFEAGFGQVALTSLIYPASIAISATRT